MANLDQERQREDNKLYNWKVPSQAFDLVSTYKLVHQHWLIKDPQLRANMTNGVGPMKLVKNRLNFSLFQGKRSIKQPDEYDRYE